MNLVYLHFSSSISFSLFIDGEYVDMCDRNKSLTIASANKQVSYIICPMSGSERYCIDCGILTINKNNIISNSASIEVVKFDNSQYSIHYLPQSVNHLSKNGIVNQNVIDGISVVAYNGVGGYIDVYSKDSLILKECTNSCIELCDIDKVNKYIVIQCVLENSGRFVVILDKENVKSMVACECDSIEIKDNSIKILIDLKSVLKIAKVITFNFATGEMSEDFVLLEDDVKINDEKLVPYVFLSAIKVGCYKLAKKYLADSFGEIDDMHLKEFFGEIKDFYYDAYRQDDKIIYAIKTDKIKLYEFVVNDSKILDILDK